MTQLSVFNSPVASREPFGPFIYDAPDGDEIVVDSFAGGGGASEGIRRALGYSPHIAINHDEPAIALHTANHADSEHFPQSVWKVDPVTVCRGRPVGLMWLSPDCTHFSKAKGAKPVSKKIRGLAWVAVRWARAVQPRIIILENVEEFQKWGPLHRSDHPDATLRDRPIKERQGQTYRAFERKLKRLGYAVEKRELVACDYGAPTSRKRLFIIARCDGEPIVWPKPTHGPGLAKPWRTAAECIDWSIPCHSIFLTKAEAKRLWKNHGIRIKRPLVANTMRRIGRGVWRFVIDNPKPYIVQYHAPKSAGDDRSRGIESPLPTQDTSNRFGLVTPFVTKFRTGSVGSPIDAPLPTVTANSYIERPGGAVPLGLVAPFIAKPAHGEERTSGEPNRGMHTLEQPLGTQTGSNAFAVAAPFLAPVTHQGDQRVHSIEEPVRTITGANRGEEALIAPVMIPRYGEWPDHPARGAQLDAPMPTIVPDGNHGTLIASFLAKHFGGHETPGAKLEAPLPTATGRDHNAIVTAHIQRDFGKSVGNEADEPLPTITGGAGGHAALVASSIVKLKGTSRDGQPIDTPLHTVQSGGNHYAEVRAFLTKYYSTSRHGQGLGEPLHTVIANDRFGLVTVHGHDYVIVDIGMRMLVPRELARAQGFHDSYILDIIFNGKPLSKEAQTSMIGNSVSPDHACALVSANYRPRIIRRREVA